MVIMDQKWTNQSSVVSIPDASSSVLRSWSDVSLRHVYVQIESFLRRSVTHVTGQRFPDDGQGQEIYNLSSETNNDYIAGNGSF